MYEQLGWVGRCRMNDGTEPCFSTHDAFVSVSQPGMGDNKSGMSMANGAR